MRFAIGTSSSKKQDVARKIIREVAQTSDFVLVGFDVASGVSETPRDVETLNGAKTRAYNAREKDTSADYWIGLESGLVDRYGTTFEEAWAVIITKDGREFFGFSSGLKVPDYILKQMKEHEQEHWQVLNNLGEDVERAKDTWGLYTADRIMRTISLEEALRNALIQIFAPEHSYYHKK